MGHCTYKINIHGVVQGVGFRPFVYSVATKLGLKGTVSNGTSGVEIYINATQLEFTEFIRIVTGNLPPLAKIDNIDYKEIDSLIFDDFDIIQSTDNGEKSVKIPPDMFVCDDCQKELFDPNNRRYKYGFINCTNCGVRYSIIKNLPYDRHNTSMSEFKMCEKCEAEYKDPLNRRYHAQPIGCFDCGPKLSFYIGEKKIELSQNECLEYTANEILEGKIVAIKGVGGYHLVCDATNEHAVQELRKRKHRPSKPFAVMAHDITMARSLACVSEIEEKYLISSQRPIVLLKSKSSIIAPSVAPNLSQIGIFLPYTPVHLLLLDILKRPIVATSANLSDEPLCINLESLRKLNNVYDAVLDHNREIVNGCDDSVIKIVANHTLVLRRARGYAPAHIKLPFNLSQQVLGLGANQKSTIAIGFDKDVILSPHIGDLDSIESVKYFASNINTLRRVYDFDPKIVIHDMHPSYESTKYAKENFKNTRAVQHHYAHILSVMAQKKITTKVLGVAFDGTGYGDDGTLWGGEFLVCDYKGFERVASLQNFTLLGGEKAIREPRRVALALLFDIYGKDAMSFDLPTMKSFTPSELGILYTAWTKKINSPLTSSMGRLFDAVASLCNISQVVSFEGESGMLLEELFDPKITDPYSFELQDGKIVFMPMIKEILLEQDSRVVVSRFFHTIVNIIEHIVKLYPLPLALSGGVFQNGVLLKLLYEKFPDLLFGEDIPPNDGGIALGQVATMMETH
ncbi:MAG: carbamoyltransferase HypF [Sulfurovaceae bacterium]|nr:carbamoyltransferase HypF [Sulfurovaceae bacterium]